LNRCLFLQKGRAFHPAFSFFSFLLFSFSSWKRMEDLNVKLKLLNLELTALLERQRRETKQPKPKVKETMLHSGEKKKKLIMLFCYSLRPRNQSCQRNLRYTSPPLDTIPPSLYPYHPTLV
jgi:hypothetical protein